MLERSPASMKRYDLNHRRRRRQGSGFVFPCFLIIVLAFILVNSYFIFSFMRGALVCSCCFPFMSRNT